MTDIVERLCEHIAQPESLMNEMNLMAEAAAEIKRLRKTIEEQKAEISRLEMLTAVRRLQVAGLLAEISRLQYNVEELKP